MSLITGKSFQKKIFQEKNFIMLKNSYFLISFADTKFVKSYKHLDKTLS